MIVINLVRLKYQKVLIKLRFQILVQSSYFHKFFPMSGKSSLLSYKSLYNHLITLPIQVNTFFKL